VHQFTRGLTKESLAVFYYSGHGAQADGANYLGSVFNLLFLDIKV
jgi:uncharacterized caspase-like protein